MRTVTATLTVLCLLALAENALPQHRVTFYVKRPAKLIHNPLNRGHSFLQLEPSGGSQAGSRNLCFGFYPGSWNIFGGRGKIKSDNRHDWDWRVSYTINATQYNAIASHVRAKHAGPPAYNGIRHNCVTWMRQNATRAGITLPPTRNRLGIDDPEAFYQSLSAQPMLAGMILGEDGIPDSNVAGVAPNDGPIATEFPRDFGFEEVEYFAHRDPATLADSMHLPLEFLPLDSLTVGVNLELAIYIMGISTDDALVSVDWGDGSEFDGQTLSARHTYAEVGSYSGTVVVVDQGAIKVYPLAVEVTSSGGLQAVTLQAEPSPAAGGDNPGFDDVIEPELLAEVGVLGGPGETETRLEFTRLGPNPSRDVASIEWRLGREGLVEVSVLDLGGRTIRGLEKRVREAGRHRAVWNLRDDAQRPVQNGLYFVCLHFEGEKHSRGVVVLR